jgi:myosin heavy subunit
MISHKYIFASLKFRNFNLINVKIKQDFSLQKYSNDDLVTLNNLNESVVLEQLKYRFSKNQIYVIFTFLNPTPYF